MIVERLRARGFRALDDVDLTFAPGLTVVRGPNETGKSSIVHALLTVLFAPVRTTKREVLEQRAWGSEAAFTLALEFAAGGARYELAKDFGERTATLRDLSSGETVSDPREIERRITALLGCPSQAFFQSTACVQHDDMVRIDRDRHALKERLQQVVTGPNDVSVTVALRQLRAYAGDLGRGLDHPAATPGAVLTARLAVADLTRRRDQIASQLAERQGWQDELDQNRGLAKEAEDQLAALQTKLEDNRAALEHARELATSRGHVELKERAERLREQLGAVEEELEQSPSLGDAEADVETLKGIAAQIQMLERLSAWRAAKQRAGGARLLAVALILLGSAAAVLVHPLAAALAVLGAVLLVAQWPPSQQAGAAAAEQLTALRTQAAELAHRRGFTSPEALLDAARERSEQANRHREIARQLGQLIGADPSPENWAAFLDRLKEAGPEMIARRDALAKLEVSDLLPEVRAHAFAARPSPDDLPARQAVARLDGERQAIERKIGEMSRRATELGALLGQPGPDPDELSSVDERLEAERERCAILEQRLAAVRLAMEGIVEAQETVLTSVAARIEPDIGSYVAVVTERRYARAQVDPQDLRVAVEVARAGGFVDADQLSRGTRDQVYLASRLALVDCICDGARPPLIVDDGLATFDDARAIHAMGLLRAFSAGRQVLLFTWSDRYDPHADHVVVLQVPTEASADTGAVAPRAPVDGALIAGG